MKRSRVIKQAMGIGVAVLALAGILAYMTGLFHQKIEPGRVEAPRRTQGDLPTDTVHKIIQTQQIEVAGTLRARRRTEVSARIMAKIEEMKVRAGDLVEKDTLLARLDDKDLRANHERARQAVREAEANLQNAQKDFERMKKLLEEQAASTREFDDADLRHKSALARLEQAREAENAARTMLSYAVISAPLAGVVVEKLSDVGDNTQPGRPILTIYDPSALRLEAAVPEALASGLKVGDPLQMTFDPTGAPPEKPLQGVIEEIVPQADAASRSVLVKTSVPPTETALIEGAFGRLLIPGRERVRLCVAQSAVREVGQLRLVDVLNTKDGTLERRQVKLGEKSPYGRVEVLSGLDAEETVVMYGPPPQPLPEGVRLFGEGHGS